MGVAHYRDDVAIDPETVSVRFAEGWPVRSLATSSHRSSSS
jgi:hypothetical protein